MSQKTKERYDYLIQRIEISKNTYDIYHQFKRLKKYLDNEIQNGRVSELWAEKKLKYVDSEISRLKNDLGIKSTHFVSIDVADIQKQFDYVFPTMKAYLESKGMILPFDASDMLELFVERAFSEGEQGHLKTLLKRKDFIEFHKMIEARLNEVEPKRKQPKPNKLTKKMEQKSSENEPERNEILNTALKIIKESGQDLKFYQTEANEANAKLYKHPKLNKFKNGNKRRWLRNAMKDGTFKKMLATDGHGTATE